MIAESKSVKNAPTVAVLLVGDRARSSPILQDHLRRRGCRVFFAASYKEAQKTLGERHYDLILSEFMVSDGTAYQFMPCLRGPDTTMFFSNTVEDGCWWLNAILEGEDRSEEPGMRAAQFRIVLDKILFDRLLRNTNELRRKTLANRRNELPAEVRMK